LRISRIHGRIKWIFCFSTYNSWGELKLDIGSLSRKTKITILFVIFLCGCAGRGPLVVTDRLSPDVRLSPETQLLDVPIRKISAVIDQDGLAHVLALASIPPELHYLVVSMEGVLEREVITSVDSYDHLDIAFDASGNLHAIVNEDHLVLENGTWRTLPKDPCRKLIRGGQDLFCAFQVKGKDIGAPGNWNWYAGGFGSYGGGCCWLIPWYSHPNKLVIARKISTGWSEWTACDVETKFEIETFSIAADNSGTLHLLYKTGEGGTARDLQCAYARIQPVTSGEASEGRQIYHSDLVEVPCTLAKLSGKVIAESRGGLDCHDIAVDPETGTALITIEKLDRHGYHSHSYSYIVEDGKISLQVPMYDFEGVIRVEPAGDGRFLALGTWLDQDFSGRTWFIYYLEYRDGMWSAPIELGKEKVTPRLGDVLFLSDLDRRRAIALWTNENDRPIARWIER
jgi:hypothetical protein